MLLSAVISLTVPPFVRLGVVKQVDVLVRGVGAQVVRHDAHRGDVLGAHRGDVLGLDNGGQAGLLERGRGTESASVVNAASGDARAVGGGETSPRSLTDIQGSGGPFQTLAW
ncbi:hypothetical protein ACFRMN_15850 [Streptomyces sp. NPDC056835]|uniref:hypothetical protein n=1 Tax=Streptomyces sp. NPDC056835 TaxID=3345956 RepID=UPI0036788C37